MGDDGGKSHGCGSGLPQRQAECVDRLRRLSPEIRRLLAGRTLSVQIEGASTPVLRLLMTPEGRILAVSAEHFAPEVVIRGSDEEVRAFLRGETTLINALAARTVTLGEHVTDADVPHYRSVWTLVATRHALPDE